MVQELLNKYIWLLDILVKAGDRGLPLTDIQRRWENRWGGEYSRRSFCNHRNAILEVFGVDIACDRSTNCYYIQNGSSLTDSSSEAAWLINSFTVNNLLALSKERLSGRVSIESIPSGQKWLTSIMGAMESNHELEINYLKYTGPDAELLHVQPYGLKEHEKRWYLVAWCRERKAMRVYSLDRIMSMEVAPTAFSVPKGFDIEELFAGSFGIYLPEGGRTVGVVFKAVEKEAKYLRDLPLHESQVELQPGLFRIRVIPDNNLLIELCRRGDRIEVLEPESLREQVAEEHYKAWKLYENK